MIKEHDDVNELMNDDDEHHFFFNICIDSDIMKQHPWIRKYPV